MTISKPRQVSEKDKVIGERIRMQRMTVKMTQGELGSAVGISFQQIQKYEKGRNRVSVVRLAELAAALNTNVTTLLDGAEGDSDALSTPITKFMATKIGVELIEAILEIREPGILQAIVSLAQALRSR